MRRLRKNESLEDARTPRRVPRWPLPIIFLVGSNANTGVWQPDAGTYSYYARRSGGASDTELSRVAAFARHGDMEEPSPSPDRLRQDTKSAKNILS